MLQVLLTGSSVTFNLLLIMFLFGTITDEFFVFFQWDDSDGDDNNDDNVDDEMVKMLINYCYCVVVVVVCVLISVSGDTIELLDLPVFGMMTSSVGFL